jgi:hypothetical protein
MRTCIISISKYRMDLNLSCIISISKYRMDLNLSCIISISKYRMDLNLSLYRYRNTAWIARRPAFWRYVINAYPPCVKRIRVSRPRGSKDRVGSRGSKDRVGSKSRQQVEAASQPKHQASRVQPQAASQGPSSKLTSPSSASRAARLKAEASPSAYCLQLQAGHQLKAYAATRHPIKRGG